MCPVRTLLWLENFQYDRYGNAWTPDMLGLGISGITPRTNVFTDGNQFSMGSYDAAGNQMVVGSYHLTYDAENRQTKVEDTGTLSNGSTFYQYDANGQRVAKARDTGLTIYVYDAFGKMTSEYTNFPAGVQPCTTCYLSQDHLGNTRLVTDEAGNTVARHDYRPFGEELIAGDGFRGAEWGKYDGVKQKFTGQEHDGETEFDFFHARYLSGAQQRFMSADPGNAGADPMNPQSWNAYAYVNNNPLNATDPTGMVLSLLPPKKTGSVDDDARYGPNDPCFLCSLPRCILCFGPGGGAPAPEPPPPPDKPEKNDVNKTWSRTFSCSSGAAHLMAAVQNDMGAFADNQSALFAARFPHSPIKMNGTYSIFPGLNNGTGGMLPSGPLPMGSLDVRVTKISGSGWTFATNPSQHYINGTVSFSAADEGSGNITFSIHAQGNFAGLISRILGRIIKAGENSNWNNMLNNAQAFCEAGW